MKSKCAIRLVVLVILVNTILSENVIYLTSPKVNISDRRNKVEIKIKAGTAYHLNSSSSVGRTKVSVKIIANDFEPDDQGNKTCSHKMDPDNMIKAKKSRDLGNKFKSKLSWSGDILFGSLLVVFSFLSIFGNNCALAVFLFRLKKLSSVEVFFVNLAIVDILLSIASYPMSTAAAFRHRWDFGQIGCTIYGFMCYFLGVASICFITSIALIRYFKTCDPIRGNQITCQTACKILALGYMVALFWAVMPLVGFGSYEVEPFGLSCTLNWMANNNAGRIYIILVTIFLVFIPLVVILFCYLKIIRVVQMSKRKLQTDCVNKRCSRRLDVQLTWISILITSGFVLSWSPYAVVCLYSSFWRKLLLPIWATPVPTLMAKSSIILNPLIYIFFTERYRNDLVVKVKLWINKTKKPKMERLCY